MIECQLREDDEMPGTVIQVGDGGRGFIIGAKETRYVVTAAHCVDRPPPAPAANAITDRTYRDFLGALDGPRNVWAECVFFDPIADLAVFCEPDNEQLADEAEAYCTLTENATPFTLGRLRFRPPRSRFASEALIPLPRRAVSKALMLSLDRKWFSCRIRSEGSVRACGIEEEAQLIRSGMSGSPIILPDGSAVGVVCVSFEGKAAGGPNPLLFASLPAWLVREAL